MVYVKRKGEDEPEAVKGNRADESSGTELVVYDGEEVTGKFRRAQVDDWWITSES